MPIAAVPALVALMTIVAGMPFTFMAAMAGMSFAPMVVAAHGIRVIREIPF